MSFSVVLDDVRHFNSQNVPTEKKAKITIAGTILIRSAVEFDANTLVRGFTPCERP
jgi:hypothetical protein